MYWDELEDTSNGVYGLVYYVPSSVTGEEDSCIGVGERFHVVLRIVLQEISCAGKGWKIR